MKKNYSVKSLIIIKKLYAFFVQMIEDFINLDTVYNKDGTLKRQNMSIY